MLWVCIQNGDSIVNVREVTVSGKKITGVIGQAGSLPWSSTLGKYDSKDRALEVLTEIFTKLEEANGMVVTVRMPEL